MNVSPQDERQWRWLRTLRADRAREALVQAERQHDLARQRLEDREARVRTHRAALRELDRRRTEEWAPELPRWATTISRHRERLFEQLEREEYALIDDRHAVAKAAETVRTCRATLARALTRREAMETLLATQHREQRRSTERRLQSSLDDRQRPAAGERHA